MEFYGPTEIRQDAEALRSLVHDFRQLCASGRADEVKTNVGAILANAGDDLMDLVATFEGNRK